MPSSLRTGFAVFAVAAGLFMGLLDLSIVTIVIPEIGRSLDASFRQLSWVVNAYVLVTAAAIIPLGKLGDAVGRKPVFVAGMALFAAASLLCGLAPNPGFLIAFRGLQGLGGAGMVTLSLALISQMLPAGKKQLGWTLWSATGGLALAAGPSLGGVLTEIASWRWVFIVNLPIAAVALPLAISQLREEGRSGEPTRLDLPGLVTIVGGLTALSLGLLQGQQWGWESVRVLSLLAAAGALLVAFLVVEATVDVPMVPLRYFRNLRFAAASAGWFGAMFAFIAVFFFLPLYLEVVREYSVLRASLALSPGPFTAFLVAPVAGVVSARLGPGGVALAGIAIISGGAALTSRVGPDWSYAQLVLLASLTGVGFGAAVGTLTELAMEALDARDAGVGAGVFNTVRQIAAVLALSTLGAALLQRMTASFDSALSRSSVIPASIQPTVASEFERRAAQRTGLEGSSLPPAIGGEIHRLASLAIVDGLQLVYLIAAGVCVVGFLLAGALLWRASHPPRPRASTLRQRAASVKMLPTQEERALRLDWLRRWMRSEHVALDPDSWPPPVLVLGVAIGVDDWCGHQEESARTAPRVNGIAAPRQSLDAAAPRADQSTQHAQPTVWPRISSEDIHGSR